MLVIIAAYVELGGKLLKLYCADCTERQLIYTQTH